MVIEGDATFLRAIEPGHTVEKRCFASAIGTNKAANRAGRDGEVQVTNGGYTPKAFRHVLCGEKSEAVSHFCCPPGAVAMPTVDGTLSPSWWYSRWCTASGHKPSGRRSIM